MAAAATFLMCLTAVAAEAPAGVAVLLNGGFEQSSADEPHIGADHADQLPTYWTLSNGASLERGAPSPTWPGFLWARLSGDGAWLEQPSSAGGEGTFQLSLYARQCAAALAHLPSVPKHIKSSLFLTHLPHLTPLHPPRSHAPLALTPQSPPPPLPLPPPHLPSPTVPSFPPLPSLSLPFHPRPPLPLPLAPPPPPLPPPHPRTHPLPSLHARLPLAPLTQRPGATPPPPLRCHSA